MAFVLYFGTEYSICKLVIAEPCEQLLQTSKLAFSNFRY